MYIFKHDVNIDFIGKRNIAFCLSGLMILISILSLIIHKGPKYGVDFAGGTVIQVKFPSPVNIDAIRSGLAAIGIENLTVQGFGDVTENEFQIRTPESTGADETSIKDALRSATRVEAEIRGIDVVGPQVSGDLRKKALFAMFFALLFIAIYISGRFEFKWVASGAMTAALIASVFLLSRFIGSVAILITAALIVTLVLFWVLDLRYAMGAIVALIHDVMITVGIFSLLGKEFTLPIIAALLTIIGYSLNDTIIVFDRIRENLKKAYKNPLEVTLNRSVNETLNRTVLTAGTTLLTVLALFLFGGGVIHDFAFAMIIGIVVGTYSSVYVASPILLLWQQIGKK